MPTQPPHSQSHPIQEETQSNTKRPAPGERRIQILQTLAQMLQEPNGTRITTASLATQLEVSEAALYRHFPSKAKMYEGLIDFIENSVFGLINQIIEQGSNQAPLQIASMVLQFSEKNPGMTRVMVGDALVGENERLIERMTLFFDKLEASLKQAYIKFSPSNSQTPTVDAQVSANLLICFVMGRMQRYTRSNFKKIPTETLQLSLDRLLKASL